MFGGLIFEYTRLQEAVQSVACLLRPGGAFYAVLQQPSAGHAPVSPSPHAAALAGVGALFRYVDVPDLTQRAARCGLQLLGAARGGARLGEDLPRFALRPARRVTRFRRSQRGAHLHRLYKSPANPHRAFT